jgi:hypothetical protein
MLGGLFAADADAASGMVEAAITIDPSRAQCRKSLLFIIGLPYVSKIMLPPNRPIVKDTFPSPIWISAHTIPAGQDR